MPNLFLSASEQRYIFENPQAIALLMIYHDVQQDQADNMGMDCRGNANRFEELKAHGRAIVLKDPDIWGTDVLWAFGLTRTAGVPGVRDIESERTRGVTPTHQPQPENTVNTMNLQPHQQRVVAEKAELDERLNKLLAFTAGQSFGTLDEDERARLHEQAGYMQAYSNVLGQRIAAFAP